MSNITPKFTNPLDELFGTDAAEGELAEYETAQVPAVAAPVELDEDDIQTNKRFDEVYDQALGTFQNQMAYTEIIEPRYAARNAEVAATYLNIALQAAATKAKIKTDRKRTAGFTPGGKVTNNTIVATREEIMRMISVDADTKEV